MNQLTPQEETPSPLTEAEALEAMQSFIERRRVREQLQREGHQGERVDAANMHQCSCGDWHYVKREAK